MKLNKIYAFLLTAVAFVGCSNEEVSWNTSGATVSLEQAELVCKENKGIVDVPVVVSGKRNGWVEVTVEVAELGENPAMEDVHYVLTSATIVIPADADKGKFEFKTVDDDDINEARTFVITVKSAKGATVNVDANSTMVTLKDNDSQLYEKIQGRWKWKSTSEEYGPQTWNVNIIGVDEGEEGYNEVLQVTGIVGEDWTSMTMFFNYDEKTKKGYVHIPFGYMLAKDMDFGIGGTQDIVTVSFDSKDNLVMEGGIYGYWNEDFTKITFDKDQVLYGWVFQGGAPTMYMLFDCASIQMSK